LFQPAHGPFRHLQQQRPSIGVDPQVLEKQRWIRGE
jgi:hypothetical protein